MDIYNRITVIVICILCFIMILCCNGKATIDNSNNIDSIETINNLQNIQIEIKLYRDTIDSLQNVINDMQLDIDNFQLHTDSIADELLVTQYKLKRIKYYNSIATGTNLKFLRGWVNRVLVE